VSSQPTAGTRPEEIRRLNRAALLRRLHAIGPRTRAALAADLGLNRSTIKTLVDGLAQTGLVAERIPTTRTGVGRPSLLVVPQSHTVVVFAVDIQVELLTVAAVGMGGEIIGRVSAILRRDTSPPADVITRVVDACALLVEEFGGHAVGVGVSVPGVVRRYDGHVHEAPNLHWTDVALGRRLAAPLGLPVLVGNDAELGALAEHVRGAARDAADMVYVSADVGVGGGVISGGSPLRGTNGYVAELGHMVVRPDGRPCYCGSRGCWETEVGGDALCRALGLPLGTPRGAIVAELRSISATPELAEQRLDEYAEWLALGLTNVVNLFAPGLVVLGDLLTALPPTVVDRVGRLVQRRSLVARAAGAVRIVTSALGRDATLVGAAELAFEPALAAL
jgi:predicted NBD/HSP70 family sugar kinase